jgi:hypothetical protein
LATPFVLVVVCTRAGERPRRSERVWPDFRLIKRYTSADIELRALWQVLRNMGDLNLSEDLPSKDRKGTDTVEPVSLFPLNDSIYALHRSWDIAHNYEQCSSVSIGTHMSYHSPRT